MILRQVIRAPKCVTDWGKWRQTRMPPSAFPLLRRRGRSYRLGGSYVWRVVLFSALDFEFRLLVAFREDICQYEALLGLMDGADTKVLASYEFHGTHDGWHMHANCDDVDTISAGFKKSGAEHRIPKAQTYHRRDTFGVSSANALAVAAKVYRLPKLPSEQWTLTLN